MSTQLPTDWEVLHAQASAAGWCLSASSQGYQAPWTYSAFRPEGIWPNYERRQFETAAELGVWVEGGCMGGYQVNTIATGDARHLAPTIEPGSVDLLFTDPVYQNIEDYAWLAETALRVLKPRGVALAWASVPKAGRAQQAMEDAGLEYVYTLFYTVTAKTYRMRWYNLFCWTTPCLWFQRPGEATKPRKWMPDTFSETVIIDNTHVSNARPDSAFEWIKNSGVLVRWIERFSAPGELVYDPFTGTGSVPIACQMTGRRFIAGEICPERAEEARTRLAATPAYMFADEPAA